MANTENLRKIAKEYLNEVEELLVGLTHKEGEELLEEADDIVYHYIRPELWDMMSKYWREEE